ncbi:MAG: DUF1464 family protein [Caldiserica bacterium]|jgi:predicted butyrate kinase (DUF1464 family)|nr:DUF1464 family protein [Caldisericota bacterium]MDH7562552.1 DUF1464 family protein [Caldisericota bacterium]
MKKKVRVIGVDPGTVSFDICGLEGEKVFCDTTLPTGEVGASPHILVDFLKSHAPLDFIIAPSGYGLPWVNIKDFGPRESFQYVLVDSKERKPPTLLKGMTEMVRMFKETDLPIFFMPGVIHLPTIPEYRKANKIDMGTADKLCCAVLGIFDQARHFDIPYEQTSFIMVEVGGAYTAVMTVDKGKIIDGIGGTYSNLGFLSLGAMDSELAYLLGNFDKDVLFSGGASYIAGRPGIKPEEFARLHETDEKVGMAWEALMEGVVKCVLQEMAVLPEPREIILSGRLCRTEEIRRELEERLKGFAPVRRVEGIARTAKEAAQGAAIIANGMAGGEYKDLVEVLEIKGAKGTLLDYLYIIDAERLRKKYF